MGYTTYGLGVTTRHSRWFRHVPLVCDNGPMICLVSGLELAGEIFHVYFIFTHSYVGLIVYSSVVLSVTAFSTIVYLALKANLHYMGFFVTVGLVG